MSTTTLHNYLQQINRLLDNSKYDAASQHCRYILQQYPRHLETYRALGKAYLEQHRLSEAVDLFQRVLSAEPNDFIAHAGLAIAYRNDSLLPNALWHMERAYEMDPYNTAVREELVDLYHASQQEEPAQIGMTRGALVRLYLKGELYEQAIPELRQLLEAEPERIDLELLLVEALWYTDQRLEVNERCLRIVEEMPYCLTANALLAHLALQNERPDAARPHLLRLQDLMQFDQETLTPETLVGWAFSYPTSPDLPQELLIEPLDDEMALVEAPEVLDTGTSWVDEATAEDGDETYAWLSEAYTDELTPTADTDEQPFLADEIPTAEDEIPTAEERQVDSDWFFDRSDDQETAVVEEEADWLSELDDDEAAAAAALAQASDWLITSTETAEPEPPPEPEPEAEFADVPDWLDVDEHTFEPDQLDSKWQDDLVEDEDAWLDELDNEQAGLVAETPLRQTDSILPDDWLTSDVPLPLLDESADEPVQDEQQVELDDAELEEEALGWLMTGPLQPDDTELDDADLEEDALDWLMTGPLHLDQEEEQARSEPDTYAGVDAGEIPDWLMTGPLALEDVVEPANPEDEAGAEEAPNWLMSGLLGDADAPEAEADPEARADAGEDQTAGVPEWLLSGPLDPTDPDVDTDELFDGWDGLDQLARAEEAPDVIDSWLLKLDEEDEESETTSWFSEEEADEAARNIPSITDLLASDILEQPEETELPDWMLHHDSEPETADSPDSSALQELAEFGTRELTGDEAGDYPNWLQYSGEELAVETADSEADHTEISEPETASGTLSYLQADDEIEELATDAQLDEWLRATDDAILQEVIETADLPHIDTDELIGEDPMLGLPDWLIQTDSGMLVGSDRPQPGDDPDRPEDAADEPLLTDLSTEDLLSASDEETKLPDWMTHSVSDNLDALLEEPAGTGELPDIDTEDLLEESPEEWAGLLSRLSISDTSGLAVPPTEMEDDVIGDHDELDANLPDVPDDELEQAAEGLDETVDWLAEFDELTDDSEAEPAPTESLPDWIGALAPDADADDDRETSESDLLLSDLMDGLGIDDADESADDLLDWLQTADSEADDFTADEPEPDIHTFETPVSLAVADDTAGADWEEPDDDAEDEDLALDWLSELESQAAPEAAAAFAESPPAEEENDDPFHWDDLAELEDQSEIEDLLGGLEDLADTETAAALMEADDLVEKDTPFGPDDEPVSPDELEALQALDDLTGEEEMPAVDELDTLLTETAVADDDWLSDVDDGDEADDEDLEEAMAWLEQLADDEMPSDAHEIDTAVGLAATAESFADLNDVIEIDDDTLLDMAEFEAALDEIDLDEEELETADDVLDLLVALADDSMDDDDEDAFDEEEEALLLEAEPDAEPEVDWLTQRLQKLETMALADLPADLPDADDWLALDDDDLDLAEAPLDPLADALDWLEENTLARDDALLDEWAETADFDDPDDLILPDVEAELAPQAAEAGLDTDVDLAWEESAPAFEDPDDITPAEIEAEIGLVEEAETDSDLDAGVVDAMSTVDEAEAAAPQAEVAVDALAFDADNMPDDPDELMAWLEKLAARQGAALDELPSVSVEDAAAIAQMPAPVAPEEETVEVDETAVVEELEAAADEQLETIFEDLSEIEAEIDAAHAELAETADLPTDDALEALDMDMPEDPDDAMAWLEEMAARQSTSLAAALPEDSVEAPDVDLPETDWPADDEVAARDEIWEIDDDGQPAESLDWLADDQDDRPTGLTDWLTMPEEGDSPSWLEAEEIATSGSDTYEAMMREQAFLTDTDRLAPEPEPELVDTAGLDLDTFVADLDSDAFDLDESHLTEARQKLSSGALAEALDTYQSLVKQGRGLPMLIGDLETAVASQPQPHLQRVLGDAYMRNGQLQKALDTYRSALDSL